jgi:hypothetical protein
MFMKLEELAAELDKLTPGKRLGISHDLFADLFPPGEPDDRAREACLRFAKQHGCHIDNRPGPLSGEGELGFVKKSLEVLKARKVPPT